MTATSSLDLGKLLGAVATNLAKNQEVLNTADTYNHDHGSNIVDVFKIAAKAVKTTKNVPIADQLSKAGSVLATKATSGSGQFYAQSFTQAASQMQGQQLTPETILPLVTTLLGGTKPQAQSQPGDLLGGLLGGLMGGTQNPPAQQPTQPQSGDLSGGLLGGLMGGQSGGTDPNKLDTGDLINAGLAYIQAKGRGEENLQAVISAIIAASPLGSSPARAQSANIIASTLLQKVKTVAAK